MKRFARQAGLVDDAGWTRKQVAKQCSRCGVIKSERAFEKRYEPACSGRRGVCNACRKPNRRAQQHALKAKRTLALRNARRNYLLCHPCIDCGEPDPVVLDFDHRDPKEKKCRVPECASITAFEAEAAKCDIRCANCHRRRHARERATQQNDVTN